MIETKDRKIFKISFENIMGSEQQIEVLYTQLKNRKHDISHKLLPRFEDHITFVKNHPYRYWVMILKDGFPIGNFYIQADNSIGLNVTEPSLRVISEVLDYIRKNFTPLKEVKSKVPTYFFVNVPHKNQKLSKLLIHFDAVPIQISYKI